jgi:transposase
VLCHRVRHHRKVSVIGALSISPRRRRLGWYLHFHPDQAVRQEQVLAFLRDLLRHFRGWVIIVWDRLNAHRAKRLRAYVHGRGRVLLEYLPPYAPELNPNEYGWGYLKGHPLANYCPDNLDDLQQAVREAADTVASKQNLLRSFVHATKLPIRI